MNDAVLASEAALNDAKMMRTWGELNALWDDIEYLLYRVFDAMLLDEQPQATRAIFYSQKSHAARRTMVEELAKEFLRWPRDPQPLKKAIKRVKARSDTRNTLAHGLWGWVETDGNREVARFPITANWQESLTTQKYTLKDLDRICVEMRDTRECLWKVVQPLEQAKTLKSFQGILDRLRSAGADI